MRALWSDRPNCSHNPDPPILAFFVFLAFFVLRFSLLFCVYFPFFSKDFKGSAEKDILAFFGLFPCFFAKKARIGVSRNVSQKVKRIRRFSVVGYPGAALPLHLRCHQRGGHRLSGPLRLRVQSRSRTRLRIAASIAFLFRACFKGVLDTIAPLSRG